MPTPFHFINTFTYKVVVYAPAERADTLPHFLLYPYMYSVSPFPYQHKPQELYILIEAEQNLILRTTIKFLKKISAKYSVHS